MGRRKVLRIDLAGASKVKTSHREDVKIPGLTEAKNVIPMRSDGYLRIRPDFREFTGDFPDRFGGAYNHAIVGAVKMTDSSDLIITNKETWLRDDLGVRPRYPPEMRADETSGDLGDYTLFLPLIAKDVSASNAAGSTTLTTTADLESQVSPYLPYCDVIVCIGWAPTEHYTASLISGTSITVDRAIQDAHTNEPLYLYAGPAAEPHTHFCHTDWLGANAIVKHERIVGEIVDKDLSRPAVMSRAEASDAGTWPPAAAGPFEFGGAAPGASGTPWAGGTLAPGTWYFVVAAFDAAGRGDLSQEISVTTDSTNATVLLTWAALAGAPGYRVYRGTTSGTYTEHVDVTGASMTDDGSLVWSAGGPDADEYKSLIDRVDQIGEITYGAGNRSVFARVVLSTGKVLLMEAASSGPDPPADSDFYAVSPVSGVAVEDACVQDNEVVVSTASDVYLRQTDGTYKALSAPASPAGARVFGAGSYVLLVTSSSVYEYYQPSSAWSTAYTHPDLPLMTEFASLGGLLWMYGSGKLLVHAPGHGVSTVATGLSMSSPHLFVWEFFNYSGDGYKLGLRETGSMSGTYFYAAYASGSPKTWSQWAIDGGAVSEVQTGTFSDDFASFMSTPRYCADSPFSISLSYRFAYDAVSGDLVSDDPRVRAPKPAELGSDSVVGGSVDDSVWIIGDNGARLRAVAYPVYSSLFADSLPGVPQLVPKECACITVSGAYLLCGGVVEDNAFLGRRVAWPAPGTFDDFTGEGAGFSDLPGMGRILALATLGQQVVVFDETGIGALSPTGILDSPWSYRKAIEGVVTVSNPVVVNGQVFFVAKDGRLYSTDGYSVKVASEGFDLTEHDDEEIDRQVFMTFDRSLGALVIYQPSASSPYGISTLEMVTGGPGAWTTWTVPSPPGESQPVSAFWGEMTDRAALMLGMPTNGTSLRGWQLDDTRSPQGMDEADSIGKAGWYAEVTTGLGKLAGENNRVGVRGVTIETYRSADTDAVVGVRAKADDFGGWRSAGTKYGTATFDTTSSVLGAGTAWSNKIAAGDGSTVTFTLPVPVDRCRVFLKDTTTGNYLQQTAGVEYTYLSRDVTFTTPPSTTEEVYAYWDGQPGVVTADNDLMINDDNDNVMCVTFQDATHASAVWGIVSTAGVPAEHVPARLVPQDDGEVDLGLDVKARGVQVDVLWKVVSSGSGGSGVHTLKAIRLYYTGEGREQEDQT